MSNQRQRIAMTPAETAEFLATGRTMVLVTLGPDAAPDPVPMWYVLDGDGRPLMRTYAKSQKVQNLRRDDRAAVLVEEGDSYQELRGVQLTGRVQLLTDPERVLDIVAGLAAKYQPDGSFDRDAARGYAAKQVGLLFHSRRTVSWDHRKLR